MTGGFIPEISIEKPEPDKLRALKIDSWSVWECRPSVFEWEYDCVEIAYILEGLAVIKTAEKEYTIEQGDLVTFPKGLKCAWDIKNKIKKLYTFDR